MKLNYKKKIFLLIVFIVLVSVFTRVSLSYFSKPSVEEVEIKEFKDGETLENQQQENASEIPIFVFHRIVNDDLYNAKYKNNKWVHSVSDFEERMKMLYDRGYKTISLDEFYCWYREECQFPEKTAMVTIDDGDIDLYYEVLPILKKYDLKAVSFIIGDTVTEISGEYNPEISGVFMSKQLMENTNSIYPNLEFASHTYGLHHKDSSGKEFAIVKSKEYMLEDFKKEEFDFDYLAYPYGAYNQDTIEAVKESGYKLAFAFRYPNYATRNDDPFEISRIRIEGTMGIYEFEKWLK